jgi:hypothetical protein
MPAMITGDDTAQLSTAISFGDVIGDAAGRGSLPVFRSNDHSEETTTFRIDGAMLLTDRFQAGVGASIVSRSFSHGSQSAASTHLGDLDLNLGYEILPEWNYSPWRPRGHLFLLTTLPTGRSIYDARETGMIDATGRGFFRIATGTILTKRWNSWDANALGEVHYSFTRSFQSLEVAPGWGSSFALGFGFSPNAGNLRFGLRIQPTFAASKRARSLSETSESAPTRTVDSILEASYLLSESNGGTWTAFAAYTDQTLLGPARNTTLSRTIALGLQKRWDR